MMQLTTHSKFYYGWQITNENKYLDFNDGSGVKTATLKVGYYTSASLAKEISSKMNSISLVDFFVSFNRTTMKFTISAATNFSLLFATGPFFERSVYSVIGHNQLDKTGSNSYLGENASGKSYATQFYIQSYRDPSSGRKSVAGVINESSNGDIEVVKFGNKRFMTAEFLFITDLPQETGSIVRNNFNGRAEFIELMEWLTEKAPVEFIKDESKVDVYREYILESTPTDSKGLDFELTEEYAKGLPNYWNSGILTFRLQGDL
jgi:hypothetical protein